MTADALRLWAAAELVGVVFYATAAAALLAGVFQRQSRVRGFGVILLAAGLGLHGISLAVRVAGSWGQGHLPVAGASDAFGLLAWILGALALLVRFQFRLSAIASFLAAMAAACGAVSIVLPARHMALSSDLSAALFAGHIAVLFVGMGCFCLAFLAGLGYLLAQHELKAKKLGPFLRILPPLETLDRLALRALVVGFVALTAGISTGILMAHMVWPGQWTRDPKVVFSLATWFWYLILLAVRHRQGWRGARFFVLIVIGFVFLGFTFLGISWFFPRGRHRYLTEAISAAVWN